MSTNDGLPVCTCPGEPHVHGTAGMYEIHGCGCVPCTAGNNVRFRQRRAGALPLCECPRVTHVHGTRIMYNRHNCPCPPCATANLEYTRDYKDRSAALPVCECRKATHVHGTRDMYGYHRCRCIPCGNANRDYNRQAAKHRKRREMVDADLVRARIAKLRAAGLTLAEIADLCAVNAKVIDFAVNGRKGKKPKTVQASTFRALNAIGYKDIATVEKPAGRKVDADAARRQMQSLHSFGWGPYEIGSRAGATDATLNRILKGFMTTEELSSRIDRVYVELHGKDAPRDTPAQRTRDTKARNRALVNGWTGDTATDQEYAVYSRAH